MSHLGTSCWIHPSCKSSSQHPCIWSAKVSFLFNLLLTFSFVCLEFWGFEREKVMIVAGHGRVPWTQRLFLLILAGSLLMTFLSFYGDDCHVATYLKLCLIQFNLNNSIPNFLSHTLHFKLQGVFCFVRTTLWPTAILLVIGFCDRKLILLDLYWKILMIWFHITLMIY